MATFSDIRYLLRTMSDIDFLSSLSNIDCYGKRVLVKPTYWNMMMSVIKQHVEIRGHREALLVAKKLKQVYIERLALVSARSFKRFFIQKINSKFVEFEIAFTTLFEQEYIEANEETYQQIYDVPEVMESYEEGESYGEVEKEEQELKDEWALAYQAYRQNANSSAHVWRGVHRNIYVKGKWYARKELTQVLKEKKIWSARKQFCINNMTEASTWYVATIGDLQHGFVYEDIGDGKKRIRNIKPRKELDLSTATPNPQVPVTSQGTRTDFAYEQQDIGQETMEMFISLDQDPYATASYIAAESTGQDVGFYGADFDLDFENYEGFGTFE